MQRYIKVTRKLSPELRTLFKEKEQELAEIFGHNTLDINKRIIDLYKSMFKLDPSSMGDTEDEQVSNILKAIVIAELHESNVDLESIKNDVVYSTTMADIRIEVSRSEEGKLAITPYLIK